MKVLFAVSNESTSQAIIKKYQTEYKQIISYKNVYYFNAILKELQRDKTYDRIVISEDLEQYVNTDYEQMDKFLFDRLDSISDEASNSKGENIPIILICTERRNKSEQILVKLFGIGIYDALLGNDRSASEVCKLIKRPRSKKDAKIYYKIDTEDVTYEKDDENDVSELEIQNILAHYKRIGNDEAKYVESFDSIASQYNDAQLKVISKCLPSNVRAVLEVKSPKYQQINSYTNKISNQVRVEKREEKLGTSEILLKNSRIKKPSEPVVIPSAIGENKRKILVRQHHNVEPIEVMATKKVMKQDNIQGESENYIGENENISIPEEVPQPVKRGRGRPRKNAVVEPNVDQPKRKRGRPRKNAEENNIIQEMQKPEQEEEAILPGFENEEEETILPGFEDTTEEKVEMPAFEEDEEETVLPGFKNSEEENEEEEEEATLPGFEDNTKMEEQYTNVLNNLRNSNEQENNSNMPIELNEKEEEQYPELDINSIIKPNQKLVAFLGTSKNGTSFLVNNVAEILVANGINTAILDLTHNRNAYYIYTKNEDDLREQSNYIMNNLKAGRANGIQESKNLTVYTALPDDDVPMEQYEEILSTLVKNHSLILIDCDFETDFGYFAASQEIYLVQSMDIITIQPLTAFLRDLQSKNIYQPENLRIVINKELPVKTLTVKNIIGGLSFYNDPSMSFMRELFNRETAKYCTIPFEIATYSKYLEGLVNCKISLNGYSKEFMQALRTLENMVYPLMEPTPASNRGAKSNNNYERTRFSNEMNDTLNQMKKNF